MPTDREQQEVERWEPVDAPMFKISPLRGYRQDWDRSRNQDGTVPTREAHYWVAHPVEGWAGACSAHAACGEPLHFDGDRRLVNHPDQKVCAACLEWAARRLLAGHEFERGEL